MKAAVLGCGGLGRIHAEAYASMHDVELTGVCDLQFELARSLGEQTGAPAFSSFEDMLEHADFDVVSIALPSFLHRTYTVLSARAGKHVICEKPIALSMEDAGEMLRCCEEHGVRLFVGHVVRFFPDYVRLKKTLNEGRIGRAAVAHTRRIGAHPGETKSWFADFEKSGGVIVDLMIHDLDFLRWAIGEVKRVYAFRHVSNRAEYALVTLQFENGAAANAEAHWGFPGTFQTRAEIAGSEGILIADSLQSSSLQIHKSAQDTARTGFVHVPESPSFLSPYALELRHFIACIRGEAQPVVTAQDASKALELALAAVASAKSGQPVTLPLSTQSKP